MKKAIKKIIKKGFSLLPMGLKLSLGKMARKNDALRLLLQSQNIIGKFTVAVAGNQFIIDSKGGLIENSIFWNGLFKKWECDVGWLWIQLSKCSNTAMDIGANIGIYSLVYKSVNEGGKVVAFEPSIHHFPNLVANNNINGFDIDCQQMAISNFTGEQTFYDLPHENSNTASLSPDKMKNWSGYEGEMNEYVVHTITLADLIDDQNLASLDLLKIDVELHEPEVLEGLGDYLIQYKPVVIIEVLTNEIANKLNDLVPLDQFELFHLSKAGFGTQVQSFTIESNNNSKWEWNFVFFHKSLTEKIKSATTLYNE